MEPGTRLIGVLRQLHALGVRELFLDGLTAEQAIGLVGRRATSPIPDPGRPPAAGAPPAPQPTSRTGARGGAGTGTGTMTADEPEALRVLAAEASGCAKCRLAEGRTQVVFGRGSGTAEVVVVGEAPGGEEDRQGLPFVGPAGKLLDLLLLSIGFDRNAVYICNVLKCRPPNNRDPMADEVAQCSSWLHGQLDTIRPKALLAVGKFAGQMLTGSEASMGRMRGRIHSYRGIPVVATYHPAYLLRSPEATRKTWEDFQLIRQVLDESG